MFANNTFQIHIFKEIFKCRINNGRCIITVLTRKRCKACRLAKCFAKGLFIIVFLLNFYSVFDLGMKAEWILTDKERVTKQQKIEENRRLRQMLYPETDKV